MQAAVVPAVSSSWQINDVPQPQPGPNQLLVKMRALRMVPARPQDVLSVSEGHGDQ